MRRAGEGDGGVAHVPLNAQCVETWKQTTSYRESLAVVLASDAPFGLPKAGSLNGEPGEEAECWSGAPGQQLVLLDGDLDPDPVEVVREAIEVHRWALDKLLVLAAHAERVEPLHRG